ncbi:hypothetical protein VB264_14340 [Arcicella aquatica]|uniref:Uncharacterized protein n=1 Tax=Arcicella aquatica TaxID=217141 RepID=A0ABU5QPG3_9BACT|nr:hypothetical protein [Arcicella aquatica]MEA5258971.1 hypothetical protein [Arcicella aquatica]
MNATIDLYNIIELINKLISKTDRSEVKWEATSRTNQFLLKMNSGAFIIEKNTYLTSRDKPFYSFKILNEIGDEIERVEQTLPSSFGKDKDLSTLEKLDKLLYELYFLAETNVQKPINDSLKKILNELDTFSNSK